MAFTVPTSGDAVIGENDPVYTNTWDLLSQQLQSAFSQEHSPSTGAHTTFSDDSTYGLCSLMIGTYTGDSSADQVIAVSGLNILYLEIWDETQTVPFVTSATMTAGDSTLLTNSIFSTDYIKLIGDGSFTVTGSANTDSTDYFYVAYGLKLATGNGSSFTPNWVEHNETIDENLAVRVANEIGQKFFVGHKQNGEHRTSAYSGIMRIFVSGYTGDSTLTRSFSTTGITNPRRAIVLPNTTEFPATKTSSMAVLDYKLMNNTALSDRGLIQFGNGQVDIYSGQPVFDLAEGSNGSTVFVDQSFFVQTVARTGTTTSHTTAEKKSGTSSVFFNNPPHTAGRGLEVLDDGSLDFSGDFYISFALKSLDTNKSVFYRYFDRNNGDVAIINDGVANDGSMNIIIGGGGISDASVDVMDGAWHDIKLERKNGIFTLFVDGTQDGSTYSDATAYNTGNLYFGYTPGPSSLGFYGYMDELMVVRTDARYNDDGEEYHLVVFGD